MNDRCQWIVAVELYVSLRIFFTEVLNLNQFLLHCFYFLRILSDLKRQNFLQITKI